MSRNYAPPSSGGKAGPFFLGGSIEFRKSAHDTNRTSHYRHVHTGKEGTCPIDDQVP